MTLISAASNLLKLLEFAQLVVIATRYIRFAQLTLLLYDGALTFEKEMIPRQIIYFWKPKKSSVTVLFFLIHYGAVALGVLNILYDLDVFSLDPIRCGAILLINDILVYVIVLCSDYVLLLRVRALYLNGRRISVILLVAYTLDVISAAVFFCIGIDKSLPIVVNPGPPIQPLVCATANYSFVGSVIVWIAPFVYRIVCLAFILYRAIVLWRERGGAARPFKLLNVIVSDEGIYTVLYMIVTVCTTQISIVFAAKSRRRMLINMKELGARGGSQPGSSSGTRISSVGTIGFVAPRISGRATVSSAESDTFELQVRSDPSLS